MYTLKLDWSDERTAAVTDVLHAWLRDYPRTSHAADIQGALNDITLYRETTEEVIKEITARRGPYYQKVTDVLIEYRTKGSGGEWFTWVRFGPGEEPGDWRKRKIGSPVFYAHLEFRLVRRTSVITDEVLDTEGE